ncbi:MAG: NAD(P)H-quinone oxidoreductase subunit O [Cyanobacteriota bacterium]|nr:NAD(P)H-quinone oxidoreductase subunit O [Cyanobacteriota bacterium]
MAIKRGSMVKAVREKLINSLESLANDSLIPEYVFQTPGEVVDLKDNYAQVKFLAVPTPTVWLQIEQLEEVA